MGQSEVQKSSGGFSNFINSGWGFLSCFALGLVAFIYSWIGVGFIMPTYGTSTQLALGVAGAPIWSGFMWVAALMLAVALTAYPFLFLKDRCNSKNWGLCAIGGAILVVPAAVAGSWLAPGVVLAGLVWGAWQYVQLRKKGREALGGSVVSEPAVKMTDDEEKTPEQCAAERKFKIVALVVFVAVICGAFIVMCPYLPAIPVFLGLTPFLAKLVFASTVAVAVPALFGLLHTVFLSPRPVNARGGFKHAAWLTLLSVLSVPLVVAAFMAFMPAAPGLATAMVWVGGSGVAQFFGVAGIVAGFSAGLAAMGAGVRALQAWLPESAKRWRMVLNMLGGLMMLGAPAAVCTWVAGPALGLIAWITAIPHTFGAAAVGLGVAFGGTGLLATLIAGLSGLWSWCRRPKTEGDMAMKGQLHNVVVEDNDGNPDAQNQLPSSHVTFGPDQQPTNAAEYLDASGMQGGLPNTAAIDADEAQEKLRGNRVIDADVATAHFTPVMNAQGVAFAMQRQPGGVSSYTKDEPGQLSAKADQKDQDDLGSGNTGLDQATASQSNLAAKAFGASSDKQQGLSSFVVGGAHNASVVGMTAFGLMSPHTSPVKPGPVSYLQLATSDTSSDTSRHISTA